jgi:hypothetical protein
MRRPVLLGVAWVAAAAVAVGLGFLAVSFVSASPTATLADVVGARGRDHGAAGDARGHRGRPLHGWKGRGGRRTGRRLVDR